ncbi:alpha/beta hydrolase [Staphylococcus chromogenes]|nr:alpha/beta hydrolase [Staphylococcus chromogenes]
MRLDSQSLFAAAASLNATAEDQDQALIRSAALARNSGVAMAAAGRREAVLHAQQREVVAQLRQAADILDRAGVTMQYVETDLDRLIHTTDVSLQDSAEFAALLRELNGIGDAIDAACAREIRLLCTDQAPDATSLSEYADLSLPEIHALMAARSDLAERFPDATILPASDGVILAFGDIETAPAVATIVPGVGSGNPADWPGYAARARKIADTVGAAVLWIDYQPPSTVPAALAKGPAQVGADRLAQFQAALANRAAMKGNDPQLLVIGHSYGSVVAGRAARQGLVADAVIFAGSPGVGADHASQLDLRSDDPRVIATTSVHDPISLSVSATAGVHGPDPADSTFGAEIWPATGDHSSYFADPDFLHRLRELALAKQSVPG